MGKLFRHILVPHDMSEHATRALHLAARLAVASNGRLVVLHAIAPFVPFSDLDADGGTAWIPPNDVLATELENLERLVRRALGRGASAPAAECRIVVGDPYRCIMDAAAEADLVVMATHGRTGLDHLVIGSVTEKVVRHSPAPVLTLRRDPPKPEAPRRARRASPSRARNRAR